MAGNISKILCNNASRFMVPITTKARSSDGNLKALAVCVPSTVQLPGALLMRNYSDQMGCGKDCFTNRCGLSKFKNPPCFPCGDKANPCEPCTPDRSNPCSPVKRPPKKESKFSYAFREKDNFESCCEQGNLSKPPCSDTLRFGFKYHKPRTPWQMLHWDPICCPPCEPEPPRFDELYYRMRKMCEREYFPTWSECPKPRIVPKVVCCYERDQFEVPRRQRCHPPCTACPLPEDALNRKLVVCKVGGDPNCVKVVSPCCCPARNPPKCYRVRQPICTGRLPVPTPSFAECQRPPSNPDWPRECKCLIVDPLCGYPPLPPKPIRTC